MSWLEWDHNAYYRRLLLRQLPARCDRVLDVGCGAGGFAAELARRARQVDALDQPGGVLAAVALPRTDLPTELPVELAAGCGHRLLGTFCCCGRSRPASLRAVLDSWPSGVHLRCSASSWG
jgi:SAM-dependent methyltransferase